MAVKYSLMQRGKPGDPSAPKKFYGVSVSSGEVDLRQLSDRIAQISTVSPIDMLAGLESLVQVVPDYLGDGMLVRLGDLGTFRVTISTEGAENEDDFSTTLIKRAYLRFRPGRLIRDRLKTVTFQRA